MQCDSNRQITALAIANYFYIGHTEVTNHHFTTPSQLIIGVNKDGSFSDRYIQENVVITEEKHPYITRNEIQRVKEIKPFPIQLITKSQSTLSQNMRQLNNVDFLLSFIPYHASFQTQASRFIEASFSDVLTHKPLYAHCLRRLFCSGNKNQKQVHLSISNTQMYSKTRNIYVQQMIANVGKLRDSRKFPVREYSFLNFEVSILI